MTIPLLVFLFFFVIWLDANRTALFKISGGLVRKLEEEEDPIAQEAEKWIEQRIHYTFVLRTISFISAATFVLIAFHYFYYTNALELTNSKKSIAFASAALALVFSKDYFGTVILVRNEIPLLRFSMPTIKVIRFLLKPYCAIILGTYDNNIEEEDHEDRKVTAEDEILSLVESNSTGDEDNYAIDDDEKRMIKGIFDLNDTVVREVMTPRVDIEGIPSKTKIQDMKRFFTQTGFSRMPVYEENFDRIQGIALAKDFLDDDRLNKTTDNKDLLHKPIFIPETKNLDELLEEFQINKNHFAVVVDEYGGTAGIVTIEDILEEIVGEIRDEYDNEEDDIHDFKIGDDGSITVDARTLVSNLNEELQLKLPDEEEYDTLGGLIYSQLGRIPEQGESLKVCQFICKIIKADDRRIEKVLLTPITEED